MVPQSPLQKKYEKDEKNVNMNKNGGLQEYCNISFKISPLFWTPNRLLHVFFFFLNSFKLNASN